MQTGFGTDSDRQVPPPPAWRLRRLVVEMERTQTAGCADDTNIVCATSFHLPGISLRVKLTWTVSPYVAHDSSG